MLLKYFYDKKLAQASYLVGCAATGEALVIDPARDVTPYLEAAEAEGLRITHVTETHIHADFVSGSRELAAQTGARIYLSDMGDADWKYGDADQPNVILVSDGDRWMVGNVRVEVLHTPGHTPEHIAFMITDTAGADRPIGIFTGDFLFVGDVGRPDLLEEAAGLVGTKEKGARQQFHSVQRFQKLPDYLQIWPGHGAGSACGKALGALPSTTLGYEKLFNPAFQIADQDRFVDWLLDGQPEAPKYFAQMKKVNKIGPALLDRLESPAHLSHSQLQQALDAGELVIDFRSQEQFAEAHLPGTVSIPATSDSYVTYVGWLVQYDASLTIIAPTAGAATQIVRGLRSIGVDTIRGYVLPDAVAGLTESLPQISAARLAERARTNSLVILDVRGKTEYLARHIRGAKNVPLGYVLDRLAEIPSDHTVVTHCASGYRSQIAASLLRKAGYEHVINLNADEVEWAGALATEQG
ncbi:MAG: MBL fold metallo-hydrolase [Anaerolineae bacterium]|nr:MBL fold metallo-hydrolase [Anaerolineae bacterium]